MSGGFRVRVRYVDGRTLESSYEGWVDLPGQGVDVVEIVTPYGTRVAQSHSLYWLYPEDGAWVTGEGSVRYDPNPLTEVVLTATEMIERRVEYLPDLRLEQIKLGWWRPGEARP